MTIGIVSDTHDHLENIAAAIRVLNERGVDLVVHLGDWVAPFVPLYMTKTAPEPLRCPLKGIFGNNDGDHFLFMEVIARQQTGVEIRKTILTLEAGGRKIACYHGTEPEITEALALCGKYDAVFAGHTHGARAEETNGVLQVNPGTLSGIIGGKPGGPATFAIYDSEANTAETVSV